MPDEPTFIPDACNPNNRIIIEAACVQIINDNSMCCDSVGANRCSDLAQSMVEHLCIREQLDCDWLEELITDECSVCQGAGNNICNPPVAEGCSIGEWSKDVIHLFG